MDATGNSLSRTLGHGLARADAHARLGQPPASRGKPEVAAAGEPTPPDEELHPSEPRVSAWRTEAAIERLENAQERVAALTERLTEKFESVQSKLEGHFEGRPEHLPEHAQADPGAGLATHADRMLQRFAGVKQDVLDHLGAMAARVEQRLQALYGVSQETATDSAAPTSVSETV